MDYSSVKEAVRGCPQLEGLDKGTLAQLFWNARERKARRGTLIYKQGEALDGTFYLVLDGALKVSIDEHFIAEILPPTLIGEGAFRSATHIRAATVEVSSDWVTLLEFRPTEEMLKGTLSELFGNVAWDRWLMVSQGAAG